MRFVNLFTTTRLLVLCTIVSTTQLAGCLGGEILGAPHDRRTFGTIVDDEGIEFSATDKLYSTAEIKSTDRIKVVSVNGIVLLAGEISSEEKKQLATDIVSDIDNVRKVVNELQVRDDVASVATRTSDRFISGKVKTALFGVDIKGFDPTRVNVTTARKVVYLQGLVTPEEGEAAAQRASRVSGVEGVVKVFEYIEFIDEEEAESENEAGTGPETTEEVVVADDSEGDG